MNARQSSFLGMARERHSWLCEVLLTLIVGRRRMLCTICALHGAHLGCRSMNLLARNTEKRDGSMTDAPSLVCNDSKELRRGFPLEVVEAVKPRSVHGRGWL